jgi:hypothetical protein
MYQNNNNELINWKLEILQEHGLTYYNSTIDVGCNNMELWENFPIITYTGIDNNINTIRNNQLNYPKYKFYCNKPSYPLKISANYVICFDTLNTLSDITQYIMTLINLTYYTKQKLFIYTWMENPFSSFKYKLFAGVPFAKNIVTDGKLTYRDYDKYSLRYLEEYLRLIDMRIDERWPFSAMYIYEKKKINPIV